MNKILSNMHTHTVYSDGKNTAEENVLSAISLGMNTLGFSDHSFTACDLSYCMKEDAIPAYRAEINALKEKYRDKLHILCGIEFDHYSDISVTEGFDYFIGASHYVTANGIVYAVDHTPEHTREGIEEGFGGDAAAYAAAYYENVVRCAQYKPLYIAHFDLPVKYGVIDETDKKYRDISLQALDAVLETGVPLEVNTGAMARGVKDVPYPAEFLVKRILEKGGKLMFGSDCHYKEKLRFAFDDTTELLKTFGVKSVLTFENSILTEKGIG